MAKGAIIKYKIAEFIPWAGFSPICREVLVQTEHCACTAEEISKARATKTNMLRRYFIQKGKVKTVQLKETAIYQKLTN